MSLGRVHIRLISADIHGTLGAICNCDIVLSRLRIQDEMTAEFKVNREELHRLIRIVQGRGDQMEIISKEGIYWGIEHLIRRPVMLVGVLIILLLTMWLPTRVLFIQVEGNIGVPTNQILEAAGECGICFGVNARAVRSEKMKNALLQKIPALQWAGINTNGCVAVISVREKTLQEHKEYRYPVSSMVAAKDGYITQIVVEDGSAVCKVGQSVEKGQLLISAYTDCGSHIVASKAKGDVFANTKQIITAVTPVNTKSKEAIKHTKHRYGIMFGKKLINFEKWSGIWGHECDRIKSVYYISLPGGFYLPLAIVSETVSYYETLDIQISQNQAEAVLSARSKQYLMADMVAGRIEQSNISCVKQKDIFVFVGDYDCNEMICKIRTEEILMQNEQRNRTYH